MATASAQRAVELLRAISVVSRRCPAHRGISHHGAQQSARLLGDQQNTDYAFEMACSNIRFGEGVTQVSLVAVFTYRRFYLIITISS